MSREERTKEELQEELRERDLPVSGTKEELIDRLRQDDEERPGNDADGARLGPADAAARAARYLGQLRGLDVDGVAGVQRIDGGFRVVVEVVELPRIPPSTDVLGAYEVTVDGDGELLGYERVGRYVRSRTGEDEQ